VSAGENGLTRVPVKPFGSASRKAVDESDLHQPEEVTKDNDADHDMESEAKKQKIDSENESNDQNISNHRPTGKETPSGKRTFNKAGTKDRHEKTYKFKTLRLDDPGVWCPIRGCGLIFKQRFVLFCPFL